MSNTQGAVVFRQIRRLVGARSSSEHSDRQLLQQFIADRDESAFALLVQRHGKMVLEVCRGVLRHQQDAEDAFQAAFLVLAQKAGTIRSQDSLSSWLHGVAYRLALKAKINAARRRNRELATTENASASTMDNLTVRELRVILHEEVHRLAEKHRASLLLCYWEGKTRDEAAELLGMSSGAFKKCLERARDLLGSRLARRGLAPMSAFFAALLTDADLQAALPSDLNKTTAQAAIAFAAGNTAGVSATAAALAKGAIQTMNAIKWATTILAIILVSGLGAGLGLGGYRLMQAGRDQAQDVIDAEQGQPTPKEKAKDQAKTDKERIVGVWRFAKAVGNGEDMPVEFTTLARLKFHTDGTLIVTIGEEVVMPGGKGRYDLIGSGKIDLSMGKDSKELDPAIYQFEVNDRLTLCARNDGKERPTEFKAEKGSPQVLFVLVRAKPGEEKPSADEIAKFKGGIEKARDAAARGQTINHLKQIGLAMHAYHQGNKSLPAHAIYSKDGKTPLLSWRVAILPFIEEGKLYEEFKLDEPWDSAHNKKLIPKMPKLYAMPGAPKGKDGETYFQVVTGPDTLFVGSKKMTFGDVTDGLSNTLLVVEAKSPVVWSKPEDIELPKDKEKRLPVGGVYATVFHIAFCDGSVRSVPHTIPAARIREYVTPAAGD